MYICPDCHEVFLIIPDDNEQADHGEHGIWCHYHCKNCGVDFWEHDIDIEKFEKDYLEHVHGFICNDCGEIKDLDLKCLIPITYDFTPDKVFYDYVCKTCADERFE
jgi:hypothetical protein